MVLTYIIALAFLLSQVGWQVPPPSYTVAYWWLYIQITALKTALMNIHMVSVAPGPRVFIFYKKILPLSSIMNTIETCAVFSHLISHAPVPPNATPNTPMSNPSVANRPKRVRPVTAAQSLYELYSCYWMEPAFDAIRGHKSAHSFATGPVIAEPARQLTAYIEMKP